MSVRADLATVRALLAARTFGTGDVSWAVAAVCDHLQRLLEESEMSSESARRRRLASHATNAIADLLFVNGQGAEADRLVLTSKDGRDLGGLAKAVVVDRVLEIILITLKAEARVLR